MWDSFLFLENLRISEQGQVAVARGDFHASVKGARSSQDHCELHSGVEVQQRLGISFTYYGVITIRTQLLQWDQMCHLRNEYEMESEPLMTWETWRRPRASAIVTCSPCPTTMIISTISEISVNPLNVLGINFLWRWLSLSITIGCTL